MARADKPEFGVRRGPGRPIQGREAKRRYQVLIEPRIAEQLRQAGDGSLSRGIAHAAACLIIDRRVRRPTRVPGPA